MDSSAPPIEIRQADGYWTIAYTAMASPCEINIRSNSAREVREASRLASNETWRIERTFSRYRDDNIIHAINTAGGKPVSVDDETAQLLRYAGDCWQVSDGLFDITSGVLRKAWTFNGQQVTPDESLISSLLDQVGWDKVEFDGSSLRLLPGMEIDFGGIGKEYAVDRVAQLLSDATGKSLMVNFGGDVRAISPDSQSPSWLIGIEHPTQPGSAVGEIALANGAVTTSGVSYRHCFVSGKKLSHILNPRTGWPVTDPPQSVTVLANYCLEAGLLSTLGMLHGPEAETFLANQNVTHYCAR